MGQAHADPMQFYAKTYNGLSMVPRENGKKAAALAYPPDLEQESVARAGSHEQGDQL